MERVARFHVFSGTGNSRYIADEIAARLEARGFRVEEREVSAAAIRGLRASRGDVANRGEGALDLFFFPVYAMSMPRLMARYISALGARTRGAPRPRAAIISANGRISDRLRDGHEGQALSQAQRQLARLGWEVRCRETFDYPHNITSIASASGEARRASIVALMTPRLESVAEDLASGALRLRPCRAWALIVGWPFGWLYRLVGRRAWGMLFAADQNCDGCGLCAARCPAGAIRMVGGRPAWSYACEGCERCINLCPKRAIQTSVLRTAIVFALCFATSAPPRQLSLAVLVPFLPAWAGETIWAIASIALALAALRLIDLILIQAGRLRPLRAILGFGWTVWTRRYPGPKPKNGS